MFVFHCWLFWGLDDTVVFVPFYIDGAEWSCRAQVLAASTTDTPFDIDDRYLGRIGHIGIRGNHLNGSGRTVAGAVPAAHTVGYG